MILIRPFGRRAPILSGAALLGAMPLAALAQQAGAAAAPAAPPAGPSMLPMLLALALVLALIPASMWLLKRLGGGTPAGAAGLKVVGQLPLGPRERLVVVEAGERWLVLGVTGSSINRVGTLPKGAAPAAGAPASNFAQLLGSLRSRP